MRRTHPFSAVEVEHFVGAHNADEFWQWFTSSGHGARGDDVAVTHLCSWLRTVPNWEVP